jgi:hypothetical protein
VDHGEVERAKVFVEGEVGEVVVNVEKESVLEILWCLSVRNPVEFV